MNSTAGNRILIIGDEADAADVLTLNLRKAGGYVVSTATDGASGLKQAREEAPALIILDLMQPKMPDTDLCRILKTDAATRHIPILMLTAKAEKIARIDGLDGGPDEYVTKPVSPREIVSRIKTILRRGQGESADGQMTFRTITVDPARHQVTVGGRVVRLTSVEFKLLSMLMKRRGRVQARDRLLHDVWGYESIIDTRTVDAHIRRLRKKLGKAADAIETVRGFGYRLREG